MKLKSLFLYSMVLFSGLIFPNFIKAGNVPLYTIISKVEDGTAYFSKGILGNTSLFSCGIESLQCVKADIIPAPTSLTQSVISSIKFKKVDLSILIAVSQEQGSTSALFYHKDDYTAYQKVIIPFYPTKALFADDGGSIIFFGSKDGTPSLFRLPLDTYIPELTQPFSLTDIYKINLSPDGKWLAYYKAADETKRTRTLGFYSLASKRHTTLVTKHVYWDLLKEANRNFVFSPDSKYAAYLDDRDGFIRPYIITLSSTMKNIKGTPAGYKGWTTQDMIFNGETFLYLHNEKDPYKWTLSKYDVSQNKTTFLAQNISFSDDIEVRNNYVFALQFQKDAYLPVRIDVPTGVLSNFVFPSTVIGSPIPDAPLPPVLKQAHIISGTIHGTVITNEKLKNTDKKPLVIWLHGGPYRISAPEFHSWPSYGVYDWTLNELAETGEARILKVDYRGSFGFGTNFAAKLQKEVGRGDALDVIQILNTYKKQYGTTKVYLMGNSYGGYLALRTLVGYPATFAGVLSVNGVTDWYDLLFRYQNSIFNTLFYGPPSKTNKYLYDRSSILFRINRIKMDHKIYVVQADRDDTVTPSQAPLLTDALEKLHKPYELTMLQGENHVLTKPESVQTVCTRLFSLVSVSPDNHCVFTRNDIN